MSWEAEEERWQDRCTTGRILGHEGTDRDSALGKKNSKCVLPGGVDTPRGTEEKEAGTTALIALEAATTLGEAAGEEGATGMRSNLSATTIQWTTTPSGS